MNPSEEEFLEEENVAPTEEKKPNEETDTSADEERIEIERQMHECQTKYIHLLAETENVRKRLHREKEEATKYAIETTLTNFLPPIDHFEQALKFAESTNEEVKQWAIGFEMILQQFKNVLAEQGVTSFVSKGEPFDPHRHEAIEMEETDDHPPGTILEEFTRGYRMGDRVIRPARVKVAKGKALAKPEEEPEEK